MDVSEYENVPRIKTNFSDSVIYQTIDNILSTAGNAFSRLFCPFCVDFFEFKFTLMDHLRSTHNAFLLQASHKFLPFEECPFCRAKFYGKHLTTKHALQYHSKVVMELYANRESFFQCMFCTLKFREKSHLKFSEHIEEQHFLAFDEIFQDQFCSQSAEMENSDQVDSIISDKNEVPHSSCDFSVNVEPLSSRKDFIESSKMICFDLTDLKQQLEIIKDSASVKKSILKSPRPCLADIGNISSEKASVRRVLRFDLPDNSEDKENSVLAQNLKISGVTLDEQSLLCMNEKKTEFVDNSICNFGFEEPKYCSTPNAQNVLKVKKKIKVKKNCSFKSYISKKGVSDFSFKCGKCAQMFQENIDLVCHMKKNHNKLTSNLLQPCYQCAICNAKFFKNRYLEKHHKFHYFYQSYKKSIFY